MVMLLRSARTAGFLADDQALADVAASLDAITDAATGRVVAPKRSASAEGTEIPDEMATTWALLARTFSGCFKRDDALLAKQAEILLASIAPGGTQARSSAASWWYFGSLAMFQLGGPSWERWNAAMQTAVLDGERRDNTRDDYGSWDPAPRASDPLGRIGTTALNTLTMEVYYRYPRVAGASKR
jgi:hypothetical protein